MVERLLQETRYCVQGHLSEQSIKYRIEKFVPIRIVMYSRMYNKRGGRDKKGGWLSWKKA